MGRFAHESFPSDESLSLETSAFNWFYGGQFTISAQLRNPFRALALCQSEWVVSLIRQLAPTKKGYRSKLQLSTGFMVVIRHIPKWPPF